MNFNDYTNLVFFADTDNVFIHMSYSYFYMLLHEPSRDRAYLCSLTDPRSHAKPLKHELSFHA